MSETITIINIPNYLKGTTFPGHHFYAINPDGSPCDLTGCSIKSSFRQGSITGPIEETFEIGTGYTVIDALAGHYFIDEQILTWSAGKYFYDTKITFPDSTVRKPISGSWTHKDNSTT